MKKHLANKIVKTYPDTRIKIETQLLESTHRLSKQKNNNMACIVKTALSW